MMLDVVMYVGVGLSLYSYRNKDKFEFDKPLFWGIVLGWPVFLFVSFLEAYIDTINKMENKK